MRSTRNLFLSSLFLLCLLTSVAYGQLGTASITGTVTDEKGAAVAGARVMAKNVGTGVERETVTSSDGIYSLTNLRPTKYEIRIEAQGFATAKFSNVELDVGQSLTLNVTLKAAGVQEVIEVVGGAAAVETTSSDVAGFIESRMVEALPLNGRNFLELSFLIPGNRPGTNYDPTKTNTLEVSSAGQFGRGGNISVDGGDNNDEVVGGTLMNFPQDGIQEFQIATNRFTAEVGRSGSSIINIITKSGSNEYHGSAFIFFRHDKLQGLPATFDRGQPAPPFDREQFGGSIGGPIKRDRAWWFVAVEDRNQDAAVEVGQRDFTARRVITSSASAPLDDFLLTGRVDFKATERDTMFVRYGFNRSLEVANGSLRRPLGSAANRQSSLNRFNSILYNWTRTISPTQVNSLIFHINTFLNNIPAFAQNRDVTNPDLGLTNELRFPSLQDGANFRIPQRTRFNRLQLRDGFSWTRSDHTLRFGGEWQSTATDALFDLFGSGTVFLTEDFATQDRNRDGAINDLDIPIAIVLGSAAPVRPPVVPFYRNTSLGFFVQDDWRARPNLTFNLGLRWEFDSDVFGTGPEHDPCPSLNQPSTRKCVWLASVLHLDRSPGYKNFGPRVGFAWDPFNKGETVIRGGYGIYYDRVVTEVRLLELLLDGRKLALAGLGGSTLDANGRFVPDPMTGKVVNLASPFAGPAAVFGVGINVIDNNIAHPYVQQFSLGIQQQIGRNWVASADGIHNFGTRFIIGHLLRDARNQAITVTDPLTGRSDNVTNIEPSAKTWYDGLLVGLQKRLTRYGHWGYALNINYTLSKTFNYANDDQIPFNGAEDQVNLALGANNLRLEKGLAPTDERHRLVFYGVFEMPFNISVSPIWTLSSSVPIDAFVPEINARLPLLPRNALARDVHTGAELNRVIDQWNSTGPRVGPRLPHVNPNLKFGDSFNSFDMRITKSIIFTERTKLDLTGEVFNLFNVTNIRGFNNNNYSGFNNAITTPDFNRALRTAGGFFGSGGPRAFQFAARFSF